jgi:hypothetical protein
MTFRKAASVSIATITASLCLAAPASAQTTLFNTEDFRQDQEHWADPDYYLHNTLGELRGMQVNVRYGQEGTGEPGALGLTSPYSFTSAMEHYQAWLEEAEGGTTHSYDTMPDWRGRWEGGGRGLGGGPNPASAVATMLTPEYQEHFVQAVKAAAEGRDWWAGAFCFHGGFLSSVTSAEEFVVTPDRVWFLGAGNGGNYTRWIYTDDSGHTGEDFPFPKWHGESIGFWDGDNLIVHTNQIRGWKSNAFEFSDELETVERYWREGDAIEGEITLYDPNVFVRPYHSKLSYESLSEDRPELRPLFNSCTDTNGPSTKVFVDDQGFLNERLPGDELYWDATDAHPWRSFFDLSDERYQRYLEAGGEPRGR